MAMCQRSITMATPTQIIWSFDTTSSMSRCIEVVKSRMQELSARLLRDIPALEIGFIAHGDYLHAHDSYLVKSMPFSADPKEISQWIADVGHTNGGNDGGEAYEVALRCAHRDFVWKPEARKLLAVIGDDQPHQVTFHRNIDNIDWIEELEVLARLGVRVFGVQCGFQSCATYFYKGLAARTDGLWLQLQDLSVIADAFVAISLQVSDSSAFDKFRTQLAEGGPVATSLVPIMVRLAKRKTLSSKELAEMCGIVANLADSHAGQAPKEVRLPVRSVQVLAMVDEGACEVQLEQIFANDGDETGIEASFAYRFALPTGAAVFFFEAEMSSGKRLHGVVQGRKEAQDKYRHAVTTGQKAFLVEENNAELFTVHLGNLAKGEVVKIVLRYVVEPEEIGLKFLRLRLPQHVAPRSGSKACAGVLACYPIVVNVQAAESLGVSEVKSLTHESRFVVSEERTSTVISGRLELLPEHGILNEDLVFDFELHQPFSELSASFEYNGNYGTTLLRLALRAPPNAEPIRTASHVAVVIDVSASMQGAPFVAAKTAATQLFRALHAASPQTRCSCLCLRHNTQILVANVDALEALRIFQSFSGELICGGGSDFADAFSVASTLNPRPDASVLISDGHGPETPRDIFRQVLGGPRIFALGVGPDPGAAFLKGLAATTSGLAELPAASAELTVSAQRIASWILASPEEVTLDVIPKLEALEIWPTRAVAYPGVCTTLYFRCHGKVPAGTIIRLGGQEMVVKAESESLGCRLHRVGIRQHILELERLGLDVDDQFVEQQQHGNMPLPRHGHTTTIVDSSYVLLFGGAVEDRGGQRFTADVYQLEVSTNTWSCIAPSGQTPSARAAHAAACCDASQLVVYGGSVGGGSLSTDELYLLDIRDKERQHWSIVPVCGPTPGCRYGHTMTFGKPFLIVFGGHDGNQMKNDVWVLNIDDTPWQWIEVTPMQPQCPLPRTHHSAEMCRMGPAAGMMVVFGGTGSDNCLLQDVWGLRRHRDGHWDWVEGPTKYGRAAAARFNHSCIFLDSKLLVIGGRGADVHTPLQTAVYDTETCEWFAMSKFNRFCHSAWVVGSHLFTYGGFDHKRPEVATSDVHVLNLAQALASKTERASAVQQKIKASALELSLASSETSFVAVAEDGTHLAEDGSSPACASQAETPSAQARSAVAVARPDTPPRGRPQAGHITSPIDVSMEEDFTHLVKRAGSPSIEILEEGRRIQNVSITNAAQTRKGTEGSADLVQLIIDRFLQPVHWQSDLDPNCFLLSAVQVHALCDLVLEIFKNDAMCLKLRAPVKIFGDLHGQYADLMRFFARYKAPTDGENGDIDSVDYLFLGDFIDFGNSSLETICLLFALKVRYPQQVHMLRGSHEDPAVNSISGFRDECRRKLNEETESCWNKFNRCFEWMPLAAVVDDRILCLHGGIGGMINKVAEIDAIPRPLQVARIPLLPDEQRVVDLLWSDPSDNDAATGVTLNETRDPEGSLRIVKFGPDRVSQFLKENPPLDRIIRSHQCVMDGFEHFANGKLITLFSAPDYCGRHKNAASVLFVRRDLSVIPKVIYPAERSLTTWDESAMQDRPLTPMRRAESDRRDNAND